ncbi:MAG: hypothetical protein R6W96_02140 [Clostridia bacterium]
MEMNYFNTISLVLAASAMAKVFFGVFFHNRLYAWAKKHYGREKRSVAVNALLVYALVLLVLVWIGTLTDYVPLGWILTVFITLASLKSMNLLFNWKSSSEKFVAFIDRAGRKLWLVDLVVAIMGLVFLCMGIWLY